MLCKDSRAGKRAPIRQGTPGKELPFVFLDLLVTAAHGGRFDRQADARPARLAHLPRMRVDLTVEAAAHVDEVRVARFLEQGGRLQRAPARLAAKDELGILGKN